MNFHQSEPYLSQPRSRFYAMYESMQFVLESDLYVSKPDGVASMCATLWQAPSRLHEPR